MVGRPDGWQADRNVWLAGLMSGKQVIICGKQAVMCRHCRFYEKGEFSYRYGSRNGMLAHPVGGERGG